MTAVHGLKTNVYSFIAFYCNLYQATENFAVLRIFLKYHVLLSLLSQVIGTFILAAAK